MHRQTSQALDKPTLNQPGLLVMDVDSTLIDEEVIDLLGETAGVGSRIAQITDRAMLGELDFTQSLRARVNLLQGLGESVLDEVYGQLHFTQGAVELIDALHGYGWRVGVVSGGFHEIVDRLAGRAHLDHWLANSLEVSQGVLTGNLVGDIVTKQTKAEALRRWAGDDGFAMNQTVAVGDGANDIPMIRTAQLGIAFCAKPLVRQEADAFIVERDLMQVMDILS